jgi:hypothetical protein
MTVEFRSGLDQNAADESWGVRDVYIYTDSVKPENDPNKPVYSAFTNDKISDTDLVGWVQQGAKVNNYITSCGD